VDTPFIRSPALARHGLLPGAALVARAHSGRARCARRRAAGMARSLRCSGRGYIRRSMTPSNSKCAEFTLYPRDQQLARLIAVICRARLAAWRAGGTRYRYIHGYEDQAQYIDFLGRSERIAAGAPVGTADFDSLRWRIVLLLGKVQRRSIRNSYWAGIATRRGSTARCEFR